MADRSSIEWTDATWNPLRGCSRVSDGCRNCYAERVAARFSGPGMPYEGLIHPTTRGWNGQVRLVPEVLDQPLRWRRPRRIFVNSMSDLFHESMPNEIIAAVFGVMAAAPHHVFQVLTKRPARMLEWFRWHARVARAREWEWQQWRVCEEEAIEYVPELPATGATQPWPLRHVWLGVSVENQAAADERIPLLLQTPATVRWLSCEPLLGPVDLRRMHVIPHNSPVDVLMRRGRQRPCVQHAPGYCFGGCEWRWPGIDWVVAGGESGRDARPMHPDWARSLRDQCAAAGVPFFFKQWGEWAPRETWANSRPMVAIKADGAPVPDDVVPQEVGGQRFTRVGKRAAGRLLDGREHNEWPRTVNSKEI